MQIERVAEVSVEVAPAERRVAAVGQAEASLWQLAPKRAQHTRFSDPGFAEKNDALPFGKCFFDVGNERRLAFGQPEIAVVNLLGEGPESEDRS